MAFSMSFIEEPMTASQSPTGEDSVFGEITIGDFSERFISPLVDWSRNDYRSHWKTAIQSVLSNESSCTILLVTYYRPENANFYEVWALYKEEEIVFVHNNLLFMDKLGEPFNFSNLSKYAGDRRTQDEDGNKISEWKTTLSDLKEFYEELAH